MPKEIRIMDAFYGLFRIEIPEDVFGHYDWIKPSDHILLAAFLGLEKGDLLRAGKGSLEERTELLHQLIEYYGPINFDGDPTPIRKQR